jgi:hypothetical protein
MDGAVHTDSQGPDAWAPVLADLATLRRLPPGGSALASAEPATTALLRDVLALPPEVDTRGWLTAHRVHTCASIALAEDVARLHSERAVLEHVGSGLPHVRLPVTSAAGLPAELAALREQDWARELAPRLPGGLLADALDADDPVAWLAGHRGDDAVVTAMRLALGSLRARHGGIGRELARLSARVTGRGPKGTAAWRVTAEEAVLGERGIQITATAALPVLAPGPQAAAWQTAGWDGFGQVTDDLGHHYLVTTREETSSRARVGTRRLTVSQICIPALAHGARRLTLTCPGYEQRSYSAIGSLGHDRVMTVRAVSAPLTIELLVGR